MDLGLLVCIRRLEESGSYRITLFYQEEKKKKALKLIGKA